METSSLPRIERLIAASLMKQGGFEQGREGRKARTEAKAGVVGAKANAGDMEWVHAGRWLHIWKASLETSQV